MDTFKIFGSAVARQLERMQKEEMFIVNFDDIYDAYLAAYPEGSNPVYRTRTEHDCSCCRSFIKNVGGAVTIKDGRISTVWDVPEELPAHYRAVADTMAELVRSKKIKTVFRTKERRYGAASSNEILPDRSVRTWNHFVCDVPKEKLHASPDAAKGEAATAFQVLKRGLNELQLHAFETVLDLISSNSLYRSSEYKASVLAFKKLLEEYSKINSDESRDAFVWSQIKHRAITHFKNTAIGQLLTWISEGEDLDVAVRKFDAMTAPENFKRTTSIITPRMIETAMKELQKLGLEDATKRRFANIHDVSVNNVFFVDNSVRDKMKGGLMDDLLADVVSKVPANIENARSITAAEFFKDVLPKATTVKLKLENAHQPNFVSLVAPVYPDAGNLFQWDNLFSWSYDGEVTDSIKEKVKRAGGNVTNAQLRVSLSWFNTDDLDLHCVTPSRQHIYYGNKIGVLDVDMNNGNLVRDPVENMSFKKGSLTNGTYLFYVDQFRRRETKDFGFVLEIESDGQIEQFTHDRALMAGGKSGKLEVTINAGKVTMLRFDDKSLKRGSSSNEKWGLKTETLVEVDSIMNSPNYWDENRVGLEHWFFILKGCKNPEPVRGIYTEFLRPEFRPHRKVFEVIGSKTKCPVVDDQLSGVGFSSSRGDKVTVLVHDGRTNRAYTINF